MYNRVILMGRLTADPELRQTQSGISMCRFSIAVDRSFARQGEEKQTDFFNVVCWRQQAEFVSKYFSKGRVIHVEGKVQNDNYTDQNGIKHYSVSIVADNIAFCGDKRQDTGGGYTAPAGNYGGQPQQGNYQQYGGNAPYNGGGQPSRQPQNTPAAPAQTAANRSPQPIELGDIGDFEEILSDGEVPF